MTLNPTLRLHLQETTLDPGKGGLMWDLSYWKTFDISEKIAFLEYSTTYIDSGYSRPFNVTYSFPNTASGFEDIINYLPLGENLRFSPFDENEKSFARFILEYIDNFTGLNFTEVSSSNGDMLFGKHNMNPGGYAAYPPGRSVFVSDELTGSYIFEYVYNTIAHEIGHSLGLSHPHDGLRIMPPALDTGFLSVVSYSQIFTTDHMGVPWLRPLDIATLLAKYGENTETTDNIFKLHDGFSIPYKDGNTWHISGELPFVVVDSGGYDVIDASSFDGGSSGTIFYFDHGLYVTDGFSFELIRHFVSNEDYNFKNLGETADFLPVIDIFPTSVIDEFIGTSGDDVIVGNGSDNVVYGGHGNDKFYVVGGSDIFDGGTGLNTVAFYGLPSSFEFTRMDDDWILAIDSGSGDFYDGTTMLANVEFVEFGDGSLVRLLELLDEFVPEDPPAWIAYLDDAKLVAATWQLFMGFIPEEGGFEYLIDSEDNATDLNDPYFEQFNLANRYIAFSSNLAFEMEGSRQNFELTYSGMSYREAVNYAFDTIITAEALIADGGHPDGSIQFFVDGFDYFEAVALERIVRPGVSIEDATKLAMISSVLYEAVRADVGIYANMVNSFVAELEILGVSDDFGQSLFA